MHKMNFHHNIRHASEPVDKKNGSMILLIGIFIVLAWLLEPFLVRSIL